MGERKGETAFEKVKNSESWHLQGVWGDKLNRKKRARGVDRGKKTGEEVGVAA